MRILSLLVVAACVSNPDPRAPSVENTQKSGLGGWIVIAMQNGAGIEGELISVEPAIVRVLTPQKHLVSLGRGEIVSAKLFMYESEGGIGLWGTLGTVSTVSHGFFAVFSFPIWIAASSVAAAMESRSVVVEYPDKDWEAINPWSRFPQGLPIGVDEAALNR